jgi:hypothetical protein
MHLLVVSMLLIISGNALAQSKKIDTFRFTNRKGNHQTSLVFKTKPFRASTHKITLANQRYLKKHQVTLSKGVSPPVTKIDGRDPLGVDATIPRVEIESILFSFDGMQVRVPRRLYSDCYNPNFGKGYLATKLGDDGESLIVFMAGSDAAGGYQVIWVLRKDGHHARFASSCSDCDYTGFLTFFSDR